MISPTTTPPTTGPDHLASARLAGIEIASITAPSDLAALHRNLLHRGSAAEGDDQDRHIDAALTVYMTHSSWTYRTRHPQALHTRPPGPPRSGRLPHRDRTRRIDAGATTRPRVERPDADARTRADPPLDLVQAIRLPPRPDPGMSIHIIVSNAGSGLPDMAPERLVGGLMLIVGIWMAYEVLDSALHWEMEQFAIAQSRRGAALQNTDCRRNVVDPTELRS